MEPYQILVSALSLFLVAFSFYKYRQEEFSMRGTILWVSFWLFILIIALFPDDVTFFIADVLGFKSNINALIFTILGFSFYLNFRLFQLVNKLNRKITELVRKLALDAEKKEST